MIIDLNSILYMIPCSGKAKAYPNPDDIENIIDHALEKLAENANEHNDMFNAGVAMSLETMFVSLCMEETPWETIRYVMEQVALNYNA